jgi:hypothetical protein
MAQKLENGYQRVYNDIEVMKKAMGYKYPPKPGEEKKQKKNLVSRKLEAIEFDRQSSMQNDPLSLSGTHSHVGKKGQ